MPIKEVLQLGGLNFPELEVFGIWLHHMHSKKGAKQPDQLHPKNVAPWTEIVVSLEQNGRSLSEWGGPGCPGLWYPPKFDHFSLEARGDLGDIPHFGTLP